MQRDVIKKVIVAGALEKFTIRKESEFRKVIKMLYGHPSCTRGETLAAFFIPD